MAMRFVAVILLLLVQVFAITDKINERRILLPYNSGVPTNFTLEILGNETACYKWSSSRPDIASVKHLEHASCSKRALVTVVSTIPKRQSSVVTAHDLKTNLQIRCDVEIDTIARITIQTTTKEIVLGESPETIKVFAFSNKNDMFTSIGGVPFDWSLTPSDVVRYRSWSNSPYAAPDFVEYWESRGSKSSMILVEGVKTGSAKIRASINGDSYRSTVEPVEINIHVVANLLLIPSNDVYLVPGATVHFCAEISKQGPRVPLTFPNQQYYLEVNNPNIAHFDEETNLLIALQEGHTTLVLKDRNMIATSSSTNSSSDVLFSRTRTDIYVMQPSYISMSIEPGDRFQLCTDYVYNLYLTIHNDWHHRLYPSENLDFELKFDEDFIEILESSKNKTFYMIRTRSKIGSTKLLSQFNGAGTHQLNEPLVHQQDATIYPPISLVPEEIYLPWIHSSSVSKDPSPVTYVVHVDASGATESGYQWQSTNESLAMVKYSSQKSSRATIYTKGQPGEVWITCNDVHNSLIFNTKMKIRILSIDAVEILPSIVEAPIGGQVLLPISVLAFENLDRNSKREKFYFDDCSQVKFHVDIIEKNRIRYNQDLIIPGTGKNSCRSLSFECLASGNSRVIISYNQTGPGLMDRKISTHSIIGCYKPLKLVHPEDQFAILSLGAGIDLAFEGGPRPWSMFPEGHYTKASISNASVVELKEIRDRYRYNKDLHIFRAYCNEYGETKIDLEVGNVQSPTLPNPASTMAVVQIQCSRPETLIVKPPTKPTCPQQDAQFTLEKNRNHELEVQILDQQGLVFYNFSTLYFEWSKDVSMGMFEENNKVHEEVNRARGFSVLTRSYQIISGLTSIVKTIRVRCRITGYHQHRRFDDQFDVRREIELILTDPLVTSEDSVTILKHSDYQKTLTISKGSGYFSLDWSSKQTIEMEMVKNDKRKFTVTPLQAGNGIITITDLCLDYSPFTLPYSVVEPIDIKVQLVDKVELGQRVQGTFFILDNRGNRLHSSLHPFLDFVITSSNNFLSIEGIKPKDDYLSSFAIKAERLGLCKLLIQSQSIKIRSIRSAQLDVQIFAPLQIFPKNITLIVGNVFQPQFIGGPQTQRNVEFSLDDMTVATTNTLNGPNGLIQAQKIGQTRLTARVTSVDNYEYSRAQADLYVLPLKKVKIWAPINQVLIGATIPMYLIGRTAEHETPFMFGHAEPSLKISWYLSNDKIGTLESSFQKFGITDQIVDQISARFRAKSVGSVIVKVVVEVTIAVKDPLLEQIYRNQMLSDTIQLHVYPDYVLSVSSVMDLTTAGGHSQQFPGRTLLMSPQSELLLHQNPMDSIHYRIQNSSSQVKLINQTTGNLILQAGDQLEFSSLNIERDLYLTGIHQYFSQSIHVSKVRYLSLEFDSTNSATSQELSSTINLASFPIGSEILMIVHYYDQLGRRFDSVKSNIKWMMSRNDIITVLGSSNDSPQSLRIRSLKQGSVVLKIWDEVNQVQQYYKILVGWAIDPQSNDPLVVQVGDVLCMRTRIDSENHQNNQGVWYLDQQDQITPVGWIHSRTGVLLALNPGRALVVYNHSVSISSYKPIQIQPITRIMLNTESIQGFSTTSIQYVPIVINAGSSSSLSAKQKTSSCTSLDLSIFADLENLPPFACDISFSDRISETLWKVELQYHHHHNSWFCVLIPKPNLDLDTLALWVDRNVTITVMVTTISDTLSDATSDQYLYNSLGLFHQVHLPFLPAFQTSLKQIILTSESREIRFSVHSVRMVLEEMLVKSSNEDILSVQKQLISTMDKEQDQSLTEDFNSMRVVVILKNEDIFSNDVSNLHLMLQSRLTNQSERIPVQIKFYKTTVFGSKLPRQLFSVTPSSATTQDFFYTISMMVITFILGFSIYLVLKKFVWDQQQKIIYVDPSSSLFKSSSRSPRIIDYHQTTPTSSPIMMPQRSSIFGTTAAANSTVTGRVVGSVNESSSPSANSGETQITPTSSPRVGRPLYSTRSFFT